ncbi:hypothetical protein CN378_09820 [Bacillus sp. AFS015802]|uniref:hypothetical protein n=1 Tax=Bacillus sp. AFS015802 TaxID=2033486 RepID=UPI000BF3725A|nr:hypothetical protein [Bacillus sp. AFS015802]PFA67808.1 hypothetical protein CN378_09820 [Bacillus sp. AFS015802]
MPFKGKMKNSQPNLSGFYRFHGRNDIHQAGKFEHDHSFPKMNQTDNLQMDHKNTTRESDSRNKLESTDTFTSREDLTKPKPVLFPPPKVRDHAVSTNKIRSDLSDHELNPVVFNEADDDDVNLRNEEQELEQSKRISNLANDFYSLLEDSSPIQEKDESIEEPSNLNLELPESTLLINPGEEGNPIPSKTELLREFHSMLEDKDSLITMDHISPVDNHPDQDEIVSPIENIDVPNKRKHDFKDEGKYSDEKAALIDEISSLLNSYNTEEYSENHFERNIELKDEKGIGQSDERHYAKKKSVLEKDDLHDAGEESDSKPNAHTGKFDDSSWEKSEVESINSKDDFHFLSDFYEDDEDESENPGLTLDEDNTIELQDDSIMAELPQDQDHEEKYKEPNLIDQDLDHGDFNTGADFTTEPESEGDGDSDTDYSPSADEFTNLLIENFCKKEQSSEPEVGEDLLTESYEYLPSLEEEIVEANPEENRKCKKPGSLLLAKLPVYLSTTKVEFTFTDSIDLLWPVAEILKTNWSLFSLEAKVLLPHSHVFIKALLIAEIEYVCENLSNTIHCIKVPIHLEKVMNIPWESSLPELPNEYKKEYLFTSPGENWITFHHETYKSTAEPINHTKRNVHIIAHNEIDSSLENTTIQLQGTADVTIDFYQKQYVQIKGSDSTD